MVVEVVEPGAEIGDIFGEPVTDYGLHLIDDLLVRRLTLRPLTYRYTPSIPLATATMTPTAAATATMMGSHGVRVSSDIHLCNRMRWCFRYRHAAS